MTQSHQGYAGRFFDAKTQRRRGVMGVTGKRYAGLRPA